MTGLDVFHGGGNLESRRRFRVRTVAGDLRKLAVPGLLHAGSVGCVSGVLHAAVVHARASRCPTRGWSAPGRLRGAPRGPSLTPESVDEKQFDVCRHKSHALRTVTFRYKRLHGRSRTGNCEGRLGFWAKVSTGDLRELIATGGGARLAPGCFVPGRLCKAARVAQKVDLFFVD